jgi:hypothetical protein
MIRKVLFATGAIMLALVMQGRTLTPQEALERLDADHVAMARAGGATRVQPRLVHTATTASGAAAVYVFDRPGAAGYLVVSADDVAAPLLGYSDSGEVSAPMPPQLQWWLKQYAAEIEQASDADAVRYVTMANRKPAGAVARKAIAPLLSTRWDQGAPYNDDCPSVSSPVMPNGKAPTGCVATAMAQVMKYFNWPEKGAGTGKATDSSGKSYAMDLGVTFSWNDMKAQYNEGNYTSPQASAVALLMKACGYAVGMKYGPSESGAGSVAIPSALVDNFGYDGGVRLCMRAYYGREEWEGMIYDNLAHVGPVLYTGTTNLGGGHAFVCDGYSTDGYFHFNWGWSGMYDGYYLLTALNPEGEGTGGFAGGYNIGQEVVLGICRPTGEPVGSQPFRLTLDKAPTGEVEGSSLRMSGGWYNAGQEAERFMVGAKFEKVGATGAGAVQYVNLGEMSLNPMQGWSGLRIPYTYASLTDGTYKVSLVTRSGSQWYDALHSISVPDYVLLTKKGDAYSAANAPVSRFTVTNVKLLTDLYAGEAAKMSFTVTNDSETEIAGAVAPLLMTGGYEMTGIGESVFLDLMPGESSDEELVFTMRYTDKFKVGESYLFGIYDPCDNSVYGTIGNMSVKPSPGTPALGCSSFTLTSGNPVADRADMRFSATVSCSSGYLASPLVLVIFKTEGDGFTNVSQSSFEDYLFLGKGQSATTEARLDFSQGVAGVGYMAAVYNPHVNSRPLSMIPFTISQSGVENVEAAGLSIASVAGLPTVVVTSDAAIEAVSVIGVDGRQLNAVVAYDGNIATVDLSGCHRGIAVITATDASGVSKTMKIVL